MFTELVSLWGAMQVAHKFLHLKKINIFGDSLVVIKWINNEDDLCNMILEAWQQRTRKLKESFIEISFSHVYREYNTVAYFLSKKAISISSRELRILEFKNSCCSSYVKSLF